MKTRSSRTPWGLIAVASAIAAGLATRSALNAGYRATAGREPPTDPSEADTGWREALIWAAASGAVLGISKTVVKGGAQEGLRRLPAAKGKRRR